MNIPTYVFAWSFFSDINQKRTEVFHRINILLKQIEETSGVGTIHLGVVELE